MTSLSSVYTCLQSPLVVRVMWQTKLTPGKPAIIMTPQEHRWDSNPRPRMQEKDFEIVFLSVHVPHLHIIIKTWASNEGMDVNTSPNSSMDCNQCLEPCDWSAAVWNGR